MIDEELIRHDYELLRSGLNERGRRMFAAAEVRVLGYGGLVVWRGRRALHRARLGVP